MFHHGADQFLAEKDGDGVQERIKSSRFRSPNCHGTLHGCLVWRGVGFMTVQDRVALLAALCVV